MEFRQLHTFKVVAQMLNFTRAAEVLNYAQSSVTAQIHALEQELGVLLFERLGKKVVLTESGQRMLRYTERILSLAEEARRAVPAGPQPAGTLTIGAPESLCTYRLPPVLMEYRRRYPLVQVNLKPGLCADVRRAVGEGDLDLAFVLEELQLNPHLVVRELVRERLLVVAAPGHRLADEPRVAPADLQSETILYTETGCSYRHLFEKALAQAGAMPAHTMEFGSVEAIKQCVMAGMGVAFLPEVAVSGEIASGRMVPLAWEGSASHVTTQLLWHKDKWLSPALEAFVSVTVEVLAPAVEFSSRAERRLSFDHLS